MEEGRRPLRGQAHLRDWSSLSVSSLLLDLRRMLNKTIAAMFGVPKYNAALEKLRVERNVEGLFNHNLVKVDGPARKATFVKPDGSKVEKSFDLLHVTPPQCPPDFIKSSPLGLSPSPCSFRTR